MKTKVKIINVVGDAGSPMVMGTIVCVDNNRRIMTGCALDRILPWLVDNKEYVCVNLGVDRFGLPCVINETTP